MTSSAEADGVPVVRPAYARAITLAGGLPVALPFVDSVDEAQEILERLGGVVLSGSADLDPSLWGEAPHPAVTLMHPNRQRTELYVGRALLERDLPILAICGGMQSLAVAAGGSLHQHLPDLGPQVVDHGAGVDGAPHPVEARPGTKVHDLLGRAFAANSAHHQAVARLPEIFVAAAHSPDGVLEAWDMPGRRFAVGVQWHPERMPEDARQQGLFAALVRAVAG